jgi:transposase-like protein
LPRKNADDCLLELRWLYDRRDVNEARQDLVAWVKRWSAKSCVRQVLQIGVMILRWDFSAAA